MPGLIQLSYFSQVSSICTAFDMSAILQNSRKKNLHLGITGILLFDGGNYLQVLEGRTKAVTQLFEDIKLDRRHVGVTEIFRQPIVRRDFNEWEMAFRDLSLIEANPVAYSIFLSANFDLSSLDAQSARKLLRLVKRIA